MALTPEEIRGLLQMICQTRDVEINCEQCLTLVAEFCERQMSGQPIDETLASVAQHLAICAECQEEYAALKQALEQLDDSRE